MPTLALADRGVSLAFLREVFGAGGEAAGLTPGRLVHGRNTHGPPDDWRDWDPQADPHSIRALTEHSGLSLVETAVLASSANTGPASAAHLMTAPGTPGVTGEGKAGGARFVGPATEFVSYTWHGMTCGDLLATLEAEAENPPPGSGHAAAEERFYWIDIFAVAQNDTPQHDLDFAGVIASVPRAVAVMIPWSAPRMLSRCWCLHELEHILRRTEHAQKLEVRANHSIPALFQPHPPHRRAPKSASALRSSPARTMPLLHPVSVSVSRPPRQARHHRFDNPYSI